MKIAVHTGLLSSKMEPKPDPLFSCTSGNCEWDSFGTLTVGVQYIDALESASLERFRQADTATFCGGRCALGQYGIMLQDMGRALTPVL
jgi:hypothetical protein